DVEPEGEGPRGVAAARDDDGAGHGEDQRQQQRVGGAAGGDGEPERPHPPRAGVQRARQEVAVPAVALPVEVEAGHGSTSWVRAGSWRRRVASAAPPPRSRSMPNVTHSAVAPPVSWVGSAAYCWPATSPDRSESVGGCSAVCSSVAVASAAVVTSPVGPDVPVVPPAAAQPDATALRSPPAVLPGCSPGDSAVASSSVAACSPEPSTPSAELSGPSPALPEPPRSAGVPGS